MKYVEDYRRLRRFARAFGIPVSWYEGNKKVADRVAMAILGMPPRITLNGQRLDFRNVR